MAQTLSYRTIVRVAWLGLVVPACTNDVTLSVALITPKTSTLSTQIQRLEVEVSNSAGQVLDLVNIPVTGDTASLPGFSLPAGKTVHFVVHGYGDGTAPIASAIADYTMQTTPGQQLTLFFGPANAFVAHPFPSTVNRQDAAAIVLGGSLWLLGGELTGGPATAAVATVESYDPTTLKFTAHPDLAAPCATPHAVVVTTGNEQAIVVACSVTTGQPFIQALVPATGAYGPAFSVTDSPASATAVAYAPQSFAVIGGSESGSLPGTTGLYYTLQPDLSVSLASTPSVNQLTASLADASLVSVGQGLPLLAGSLDNTNIATLDLEHGALTTVGHFAFSRPQAAAVVASSTGVFIAGGGLAEVEMWVSPDGPASQIGSLPQAETAVAMAVLPDASVMVAGGQTTAGPSSDAWVFSANNPMVGPFNLVTARSGAILTVLGQTVLLYGGASSGPTVEIMQLDPSIGPLTP